MDFQGGSDASSVDKVRWWTFFWGLVGIGAAFICLQESANLLQMAYKYLSLFTGPLLGFFLAAFFFPRLNPRSIIVGAVGGMLVLWVYPQWAEQYDAVIKLAWPWNPIISLVSMALVTAMVEAIIRKYSRD